MSTATAPNTAHIASPRDDYSDDFLGPRNSPDLKPLHPRLRPSPSPEPPLPPGQVSPPPKSGRRKSNRPKVRPSQGDAVLVGLLDGGRRPEIAARAGQEALPSDPEDVDEETGSSVSDSSSSGVSSQVSSHGALERSPAPERRRASTILRDNMTANAARAPADGGAIDLISLAAGALAATKPRPGASPESENTATTDTQGVPTAADRSRPAPPPPVIAIRRDARLPDESPVLAAAAAARSPYSQSSVYSPGEQSHLLVSRLGIRSPTAALSPSSLPPNAQGDLPPINSPGSDGNSSGHGPLPSIRAQLGDIKALNYDGAKEVLARRNAPILGPSRASIARYSTAAPSHASPPPISPNGAFARQDHPSPGHPIPGVPYYPYHPGNGMHRPHHDYSSSTTETPSTDQSASTPATSVTDRMSIDGITNPVVGAYVCRFAGCTAPPFQTQYLLNSHANVHSSARPHYCPVKGCPRSEGGKGFKRKNEMIRHGLVHDSPGYVCPFCPDREHKYPRPDNLQRHVRVHHVDKDKDDPALRDVLAQRPDGPSRGRRRRGGPT